MDTLRCPDVDWWSFSFLFCTWSAYLCLWSACDTLTSGILDSKSTGCFWSYHLLLLFQYRGSCEGVQRKDLLPLRQLTASPLCMLSNESVTLLLQQHLFSSIICLLMTPRWTATCYPPCVSTLYPSPVVHTRIDLIDNTSDFLTGDCRIRDAIDLSILIGGAHHPCGDSIFDPSAQLQYTWTQSLEIRLCCAFPLRCAVADIMFSAQPSCYDIADDPLPLRLRSKIDLPPTQPVVRCNLLDSILHASYSTSVSHFLPLFPSTSHISAKLGFWHIPKPHLTNLVFLPLTYFSRCRSAVSCRSQQLHNVGQDASSVFEWSKGSIWCFNVTQQNCRQAGPTATILPIPMNWTDRLPSNPCAPSVQTRFMPRSKFHRRWQSTRTGTVDVPLYLNL